MKLEFQSGRMLDLPAGWGTEHNCPCAYCNRGELGTLLIDIDNMMHGCPKPGNPAPVSVKYFSLAPTNVTTLKWPPTEDPR